MGIQIDLGLQTNASSLGLVGTGFEQKDFGQCGYSALLPWLAELNTFPSAAEVSPREIYNYLNKLDATLQVAISDTLVRHLDEVRSILGSRNLSNVELNVISGSSNEVDNYSLFISSPLDLELKDRFFRNQQWLPFLEPVHLYSIADGNSPLLVSIGTHRGVIDNCQQAVARFTSGLSSDPLGLQEVLCSDAIKKVYIHALGPIGTNIAQVAEKYIDELGIAEKALVIVHNNGVVPLVYAQTAAELQKSAKKDEIHLHIECLVYNDMGKLYQQRAGELTFADYYHMPLDVMQLATRNLDVLKESVSNRKSLKIASHPSPRELVYVLENQYDMQVGLVSSNAAAAIAVSNGQFELCITTASAAREQGLHTLHTFGSPDMLFTIGTPLTRQQLNALLRS